ncbi:MAG: phosphatidate cytidylyltransferase [Planctomycetes bacterium]|nr:phosphatidate cytidylyltransferase [Planctomycetota bacterium]
MKDLKQRLTFGPILIAAVVGLFILDRDYLPGIAMVVLGLLTLAAQHEFYGMLERHGLRARRAMGALFGAVTLAAAWWLDSSYGLPLLVGMLVLLLVVEILGRNPKDAPTRIGTTLLGWLVVPLLLSSAVHIRGFEKDGWDWLMLLIVCCKVGDSAAYLVGSAIGKHKLIPEVSPNKSWEGAAASLLGAVIGGYLVMEWAFGGRIEAAIWIPAAIITNVGAQFGDLAESLLKRGCETKDSASTVPAFGGTFDMVDSFLIAAPALHGYLLLTVYSS